MLNISGTGVTDLLPLKGGALHSLRLEQTRIRDLSPLRDAPIKDVWFDPRLRRDQSEIIRTWKNLETINGAPPSRELIRRPATSPGR